MNNRLPRSMTCRRLAEVVTFAAVLSLYSVAAYAQGRYVATFVDGSSIVGQRVRDLHSASRPPELDEQPLIDERRRIRLLRDTTLEAGRPGPRIELIGGDVLPGRVVTAGESDGRGGGAFITLEPPSGLASPPRGVAAVRVRAAAVRRLVFTHEEPTPWSPGKVRLRDGRHYEARSLRWGDSGVRVLTGEGLAHVGWSELAEICPPAGAEPQPPGAVWRGVIDAGDRFERIHTRQGAQLTFPQAMTHTDFGGRSRRLWGLVGVQPAWALEPILFAESDVALRTYLEPTELPLTALHAEELPGQKLLHAWPWRLGRSVRGGVLRSGSLTTDLGVGMHVGQRVAFMLPPGAQSFSAFVGLDRTAGLGGCARCRVLADSADGAVLWESDILLGGGEPVAVGPLDVRGARRLVLVVDPVREGRPATADPLDIRGHVDWLLPIVAVDLAADAPLDLHAWIPPLTGWELPASDQRRIALRPVWGSEDYRFHMSLVIVSGETARDAEPLRFVRRERVSLANAYLLIDAARDQVEGFHRISVEIDGEPCESTMNGDVTTNRRPHGRFDSRVYILGAAAGREVELAMVVASSGLAEWSPPGVLFRDARLQPLVEGLPPAGEAVQPDVPLASLTPLEVSLRGDRELSPGRLTNGRRLNVQGYRFTDGFGLRDGAEITYQLDGSWRKFVAVAGLADGWQGVGPYEILLDGEPFWSCGRSYGRNTPGLQIAVDLPDGRQTITLRVRGAESYGALANAGFLTE